MRQCAKPRSLNKLFVCQTCERDRALDEGGRSRGARLADAIVVALEDRSCRDVLLVRVACLNGCRNPCNVALRAPRKFSLRLSRMEAGDASAICALLDRYCESDSGEIAETAWPKGLRARVTAHIPPPHLLGR